MRKKFDFYETPHWQTDIIWDQLKPFIRKDAVILDCCAGENAIVNRLLTAMAYEFDPTGKLQYYPTILSNDIDKEKVTDLHYDARDHQLYDRVAELWGPVDWVIINPPFQSPLCMEILDTALRHARVGVASILRLSFREPTQHRHPRAEFLECNPITQLITMSRHSYDKTGKTDSVTTEWAVWDTSWMGDFPQSILSIPKPPDKITKTRYNKRNVYAKTWTRTRKASFELDANHADTKQ